MFLDISQIPFPILIILVIIGAIVLFSSSSSSSKPNYKIQETADPRYFEVIDSTGNVVFFGTKTQCENYIFMKTSEA